MSPLPVRLVSPRLGAISRAAPAASTGPLAFAARMEFREAARSDGSLTKVQVWQPLKIKLSHRMYLFLGPLWRHLATPPRARALPRSLARSPSVRSSRVSSVLVSPSGSCVCVLCFCVSGTVH